VKEPECSGKYYIFMYENGKMRPVETIPGEGDKENDGGSESHMYPHRTIIQ
jgi:hypothetical protein